MSNREYRNRLDRATQIRCSVRWEGEEGTGGQPWAPCIALHTPNLHCAPYTQLALRPTHPTCIVLYTPHLHCAPYTQMCVHPTQNKYFHRLLFKTAVADGNAVEFCWNISCRPGRELTLLICCETSVDIIRVAKWGFEFKLRKDRKKEERRKWK